MQLNIFISEQKGQKLHTLNWEYLQVFFCHVIFRTAGYLKASLSTFNCDGKFSLWVSAEEIFHFHITVCSLFRTLVSNLEVSTRQQTSNSRVDFFSSDIENFDLLSSSVRVPSFRMTTQRTYKLKGTTYIFLVHFLIKTWATTRLLVYWWENQNRLMKRFLNKFSSGFLSASWFWR